MEVDVRSRMGVTMNVTLMMNSSRRRRRRGRRGQRVTLALGREREHRRGRRREGGRAIEQTVQRDADGAERAGVRGVSVGQNVAVPDGVCQELGAFLA